MNNPVRFCGQTLFAVLLLTLCAPLAYADVRLPRLVSDGMVLQRDTRPTIWGWCSAGEEINLTFGHRRYHTTGTKEGRWEIRLAPAAAGGPYEMVIDGNNHVVVQNILVGDVFVCSGQSNMELPMERVKEKFPEVIANSANTNIRQYNNLMKYNFKGPQDDLQTGSWLAADPKNVMEFSAVAYFFAKSIYEKYHVPVGIIKSAVGGSPAEAWLSEPALKAFPQYLTLNHKYRDNGLVDSIQKSDAAVTNNWNANIDKNDQGLTESVKWYDSNYMPAGWSKMNIPGYWSAQGFGNTNGVLWFRKEIDVPANMAGTPAKLLLGTIVDRDMVYVNGVFSGTTGYQYPPRRYSLPAGVLKAGKNVIVVRVVSNIGRGGFTPDKTYSLTANGQTIDLKGEWQAKVGYASAPLTGNFTTFQYQPGGLFNAMIAPLLKYSVKGVLWYQGESNAGRAKEYQTLFPALIADWRAQWKNEKLPFVYAQLPNYMTERLEPSESQWAELREAQLKTLSLPNTGMSVNIDLGEWNDIHPLDKESVGKRLFLAVQKVAYQDKKVVYSGPVYQSMQIQGNKIVVTFSNTGSGMIPKDGKSLKYFAVAGADGKFKWAKAEIKGNTVIVSNETVADPVAVRYAWADNPVGANLYNKEGLPASPFRTGL